MAGCLLAIMTGNLLGATSAGLIADLFGWPRGILPPWPPSLSRFLAVFAIPGLRGVGSNDGRFDIASVRSGYRAIFSNPLSKVCFAAVFVERALMYGLFRICRSVSRYGRDAGPRSRSGIGGFGSAALSTSLRVGWLLRTFAKPR